MFGKSVSEFAFEDIIEFVHSLPCRLQVEAALHHLQPKMVLFVDHYAKPFLRVEDDGSRPFRFAQFMADQLPFHEELSIEISEFRNVDEFGFLSEREGFDRSADGCCDGGAVLLRAFADERKIREVPGQAYATTHDDIGLGAVASHPFAGLLG